MNGRAVARVQGSTACWPGLSFSEALARLRTAQEPAWGPIQAEHVQLCPQNSGALDEATLAQLQQESPGTQFRLHANVRIGSRRITWNAAQAHKPEAQGDFQRWAALSRWLNAPAYTLHAGRRDQASLPRLWDNIRRLEQWFGCPVGVEGHYTTPEDAFLLSTWAEYALLLEAGVSFVVDLSHLNIVAHQSGGWEPALVRELLAHPKCIEIHLSGNDGRQDHHQALRDPPEWAPFLTSANGTAVWFTEGNQLR
ncbi:apurinic/apyrimidinic endonuclease family protein [Thiomonas sp.]